MPRRKLIRPAEPLTPPEPGSLEENIWLGDQAAVHANAGAQLRWYDRRGELLIAIQNRNKIAERVKELEAENKGLREQVAQPPVPADPQTERRVNKLFQQLEAQRLEPSTPVSVQEPSESTDPQYARGKAAVERRAKEEAEKKAKAEQERKDREKKEAEEAAKKEAARAARIAELQEHKSGILKTMSDPLHLRACVDNPAVGYGLGERLNEINAELRRLEGTPVQKAPDPFNALVDEQRQENARTQRQYQREYDFLRSGMQITPPSNMGLFREDE